MMPDQKLLCFGYGYTARFFAKMLMREGWRIVGTTRSAEKAAQLNAEGIQALIWDGGEIDPDWLSEASAILISVPPDDSGCPAFAAAADHIASCSKQPQWIGYLSTNGVYGDHDGAWVTEDSELRATAPRARRRIKAETQWRDFAQENDLPLIVFRLPGIYGPGRCAIDTVREGKAKRIYKEGQVFSRMHVADIANALKASMTKPRQHDLYNLADNEPAPPQDVIEYACKLLGRTPPPLTPIDQANLSDMAKSFYADNKRVSNQRMKDALGIELLYPNYRDGLEAILENEC